MDDIVAHLQDILDGPVPVYVSRQDLRDVISEITRLTEERNMWQSTAAGLSQDISNAEDEIERLRQKEEDILAGIQLVVKGSNAGRDKEIELLRSAGDALVDVLRSGSDSGWDDAIDAWERIVS